MSGDIFDGLKKGIEDLTHDVGTVGNMVVEDAPNIVTDPAKVAGHAWAFVTNPQGSIDEFNAEKSGTNPATKFGIKFDEKPPALADGSKTWTKEQLKAAKAAELQIMIGVGVGAVVLIGGAIAFVVIRRRKK